jgi:hypothetical protein
MEAFVVAGPHYGFLLEKFSRLDLYNKVRHFVKRVRNGTDALSKMNVRLLAKFPANAQHS